MIILTSNANNKSVNLPTVYSDITPDYVAGLVKDINVRKHYCIIAVCVKQSLMGVSLANKLTNSVSVVPIIAKVGAGCEDLNVGDKPIISASSIERGVHVPVASTTSVGYINNFINSDTELMNKIRSTEVGKKDAIFIHFKIVPNTDIIGTIPNK